MVKEKEPGKKAETGFKIKPVAPLMIEHRLVERMIAVIKEEAAGIGLKNKVDPVLIDTAVGFIRTYADRTHHGKEEEILFRDLAQKKNF